jgi:hypothetical protein
MQTKHQNDIEISNSHQSEDWQSSGKQTTAGEHLVKKEYYIL